uniref:MATH domain-containing protein n=1 Tax=Setaria viridis TaxID=4556 RepID=A0A4U6TPG3_SETVI|nr:hypothetical protein SEVIR_7G032900v2 [Setaria viridis]
MAVPAALEPATTDDEPHSTSAIVGGWVTGRHSRPFRIGGRSWSMRYYPNGLTSQNSDFICIVLQLVRSSYPPVVKAKAIFSLLDQASKPVPSHTRTTVLRKFSDVPGNNGAWGFSLIRRDFLEKSEHLRDDCFRFSCDVIVRERQAMNAGELKNTREHCLQKKPSPAMNLPSI